MPTAAGMPDARALCRARGIVYQGFSLLTANTQVLSSGLVLQLAKRYDCSPAQLIFRFAEVIGILPLTGTTRTEHMRADLDCLRMELDPHDVLLIEALA